MTHFLHMKLPKGAQLELMNVRVEVKRASTDDDADFVMVFEDMQEQVQVYVPMSPGSFRDLIERAHANLSPVVIPKPKLEIAGRIKT